MTYGLSTGVFVENGPAVQVERLRASHSTARSWRALDTDRRFDLVQQALRPANDLIDGYPLAL